MSRDHILEYINATNFNGGSINLDDTDIQNIHDLLKYTLVLHDACTKECAKYRFPDEDRPITYDALQKYQN